MFQCVLLAADHMWKGKRVTFAQDGYASMFIGEKTYDCRHGPDRHVASKEKYKKQRDVSVMFVLLCTHMHTHIHTFMCVYSLQLMSL